MRLKSPASYKLGVHLQVARERAGLTQEKLAESIGATRQTIINYENDKTSATVDDFLNICRVLDVLPSEFFKGIEGRIRKEWRIDGSDKLSVDDKAEGRK